MSTINVARDFSPMPEFRYAWQSPGVSGEEFRNNHLKPAYLRAREEGETLTVELDGVAGYLTSFLEEAFGGLQREILDENIMDRIVIISKDEPHWEEEIKRYVKDELAKRA